MKSSKVRKLIKYAIEQLDRDELIELLGSDIWKVVYWNKSKGFFSLKENSCGITLKMVGLRDKCSEARILIEIEEE